MLRIEASLEGYRGYLILFVDEVDNVRRDQDTFLTFLVRRLPQRIPARLVLVFASNRLNWSGQPRPAGPVVPQAQRAGLQALRRRRLAAHPQDPRPEGPAAGSGGVRRDREDRRTGQPRPRRRPAGGGLARPQRLPGREGRQHHHPRPGRPGRRPDRAGQVPHHDPHRPGPAPGGHGGGDRAPPDKAPTSLSAPARPTTPTADSATEPACAR